MGGVTHEQLRWVIQPLLAAGLDLDEIGDLLYRFAFDDIVSGGHAGACAGPHALSDQPSHVRAAWLDVVGRMLTLHGPTS